RRRLSALRRRLYEAHRALVRSPAGEPVAEVLLRTLGLEGGQHSGFRLSTVVPVRTVLRQVEARLHEDDLEVLHALPLVALSQTNHVVLHSTGRSAGFLAESSVLD